MAVRDLKEISPVTLLCALAVSTSALVGDASKGGQGLTPTYFFHFCRMPAILNLVFSAHAGFRNRTLLICLRNAACCATLRGVRRFRLRLRANC